MRLGALPLGGARTTRDPRAASSTRPTWRLIVARTSQLRRAQFNTKKPRHCRSAYRPLIYCAEILISTRACLGVCHWLRQCGNSANTGRASGTPKSRRIKSATRIRRAAIFFLCGRSAHAEPLRSVTGCDSSGELLHCTMLRGDELAARDDGW